MSESFHFEGDPATESARRHLERVLNEPAQRQRRWPAIAGMLTGLAAWYFWPRQRESRRPGESPSGARHSGRKA
jgi:hypothetical protein